MPTNRVLPSWLRTSSACFRSAACLSFCAASCGSLTGCWLTETMTSPGSTIPAAGLSGATPSTATPPPFLPNQADYYDQVKQAAPGARSFQMWGPNVTVTFASYTDSFGKAMQGGTPFAAALDAMQDATVTDMKKLGFTLN